MGDSSVFSESADDLATLARLDENVLLSQLRARYDRGDIYTYIGDILVAVNPFRPLTIYTQEWSSKYRSSAKGEQPPHIFALADWAFHNMLDTSKSQCCVVSGESGAGKTESAKLLIRHILELAPDAAGSGASDLERKILQVNPLLEAYGNAQTIMNDNSSRFGKYTELVFNASGTILGARIFEYLLEKSRVVWQAEGEQNFHIFYYIFASPDTATLRLGPPEAYRYMSNVGGMDVDISEMYSEVVSALYDVGFSKSEQDAMLRVLAAILHLGEVEFKSSGEYDPVSVHPESDAILEIIAQLLEVEVGGLRHALEEAVNFTRGETIRKRYNREQAYDSKDAMSKALYGRMFGWLVSHINQLLVPSEKRDKAATTIGILDIFGFENFRTNSFEQWCINLANEQLQHFFNQHIFELELEEYRKEGIDAMNITYVDNKPLLDMYLEKPIGLFALLDEESLFPKGTDESLVQKFVLKFKDHKNFVPAKNNDPTFTIVQYAGRVEYNARGFLFKNRDSLASDVVGCLQTSGLDLVSSIFLGEVTQTGKIVALDYGKKGRSRTNLIGGGAGTGAGRPAAPSADLSTANNTASKRAPTVGRQFTLSLQQLVERMMACRPHFVRCIKPNMGKAPYNYVDEFVMVQLNYTGMLETTRIRREGYAVRPTFADFVSKFKLLAFRVLGTPPPDSNTCIQILDSAKIKGWLLGKTKVFLKYYHVDELESVLIKMKRMAVSLQKCARGFLARRRHREIIRKAEEQRKEAGKFFDRINKMSERVHTTLIALRQYDIRLQNDLALRAEAERRRQLAEKQQQERERAEAERRRQEEEANHIKAELEAMQAEHEEMSNRLTQLLEEKTFSEAQRIEQEALVAELETRLVQQQEDLNAKINEHQESVRTLRQDLREREADLNSSLVERESIIRELTTKLERGDEVQETLRETKLRLRAQEVELDDARSNVSNLTRRLESQMSLLDTTKSAHSQVVSQLNGLLAKKESVAGTLKRELDTIKQAKEEAEHKSMQASERIAMLERQLQERAAYIAQLEADLDSHREMLDRATQEHERDIVQLRDKLKTADSKALDLTVKLERATAAQQSAQEESASIVSQLRGSVAEKDRMIERLRNEAEAAQRDLETRLREKNEELHRRVIESEEKMGLLRLEAQQKDVHLRSMEKEKEAAIRELTERAEKGEADASSGLRAQMRAANLQVEESQAEIARLQSRLTSQQSLFDLTKLEHENIVSELKRLLKSKESLAATRHEEHEHAIADLDAKYRAVKLKMDTLQQDGDSALSEVKYQLRQQESQHQTELADKDRVIRDLKTKVDFAEAQTETEKTRGKSLEGRLKESQSEMDKLAEKLEKQFALSTSIKAAHDELQHQLSQLQEDKASTEATLRDESNRALAAKDMQISALKGDMEQLRTEQEKALWSARDEHESEMAQLQKELSERERQVSELQMQAHHAESQLGELNSNLEGQEEMINELQARIQTLEDDLSRAHSDIANAESFKEDLERQKAFELSESMRAMEELQRNIQDQKEMTQAAYQRMCVAIKSYARKKVPDEEDRADVDLLRFITYTWGERAIPSEISVTRFACKGYLMKLAGKAYQKRWFVFSLEKQSLLFYQDNRELRIHLKGELPMAEITRATVPKGDREHVFIIETPKRPYSFKATSDEIKLAWVDIINSIAR